MDGKVWNKEDLALVEQDQTGEPLDKHKPRGPSGAHQVLSDQCHYKPWKGQDNLRGGGLVEMSFPPGKRIQEASKPVTLILSLGMLME